MTLDKSTADTVARHLVAAGELIDEDPEAALAHAQAARSRSGRIAAIREAVGIAAYHCGDWAQALSEFRAARRMGSKSQLLPLIADCERGSADPSAPSNWPAALKPHNSPGTMPTRCGSWLPEPGPT